MAAATDQAAILWCLAALRPTAANPRPPLLVAAIACGAGACTTSLGLKAQIDRVLQEWRDSCPVYAAHLVGPPTSLAPCPIRCSLEVAFLSALARRLARLLLFALLERRRKGSVRDETLDALLKGVGEEDLIPKRGRHQI
jgi:hypothetical protein